MALPPSLTPDLDSESRHDPPLFSWTAIPGATAYELWVRNLSTGVDRVVYEPQLTSNSYQPQSALGIGGFAAWIRPIDARGVSMDWSQRHSFTISTTPELTAPEPLTNSRKPQFDWTAVVGASGYELWVRDLTRGIDRVLHESHIHAPYSGEAAFPDGRYRAWIRAESANGFVGNWSEGHTFQISNAPEFLTANGDTSDSTPTLDWTTVNEAQAYEVWINRNAQFYELHQGIGENTFEVPGPLPIGDYDFWVRGNLADESKTSWSPVLHIGIKTPPVLSEPSGVITAPEPVLSWQPVGGAVEYEVWVSDLTAARSPILRQIVAGVTSWQVPSPLVPGHLYRFWVRAFDETGWASDWSEALDFNVASFS